MKEVTVYPVPGRYLVDVPAVPHLCTDPRCVASGAFTTEAPKKADPPAKPKEE
jgi:hypothetical protein